MKVILLAGGLGSRLAEETEVVPKPMVEIGRYLIIWHITKHYASYGHKEFIIALEYKGEVIKRFFLEQSTLQDSSIDPEIVARVKRMIGLDETVLVILDSNHTKVHVLAELQAYHSLVTPNSYIVATDGNMQDLYETPRGKPECTSDHPSAAEFASYHPDLIIEQPSWLFNESNLDKNITHWPSAWLRRI